MCTMLQSRAASHDAYTQQASFKLLLFHMSTGLVRMHVHAKGGSQFWKVIWGSFAHLESKLEHTQWSK